MKKSLRFVCFAALFLALLSLFTLLLMRKPAASLAVSTDQNLGFYDEPENSIDVLYVGPSHAFCGISPLDIYHEYGITGYVRSTSLQKIWNSETVVRESLKYQKPKVLLLEVGMMYNILPHKEDWPNRELYDTMRPGLVKLGGVEAVVQREPGETLISYIFPILRYHERWRELDGADLSFLFQSRHMITKGFKPNLLVSPPVEPEEELYSLDTAPFEYDASVEAYLSEIKSLCQSAGVELVLLKVPTQRRAYWDGSKHLATVELADKLGVPFLDYNVDMRLDEEIDWDTETSDEGNHINYFGAMKFSHSLGKWLTESYSFDRPSDAVRESWDADYALYRAAMDAALAGR